MTPPVNRLSPRVHYFLHALLGGVTGFGAALMFWAVYFGQQFYGTADEVARVTPLVRAESAFIITVLIIGAIFAAFYRKTLIARFREATQRLDEHQ